MKEFILKMVGIVIGSLIAISIIGWSAFWLVVGIGCLLWTIHSLLVNAVCTGTLQALEGNQIEESVYDALRRIEAERITD